MAFPSSGCSWWKARALQSCHPRPELHPLGTGRPGVCGLYKSLTRFLIAISNAIPLTRGNDKMVRRWTGGRLIGRLISSSAFCRRGTDRLPGRLPKLAVAIVETDAIGDLRGRWLVALDTAVDDVHRRSKILVCDHCGQILRARRKLSDHHVMTTVWAFAVSSKTQRGLPRQYRIAPDQVRIV